MHRLGGRPVACRAPALEDGRGTVRAVGEPGPLDERGAGVGQAEQRPLARGPLPGQRQQLPGPRDAAAGQQPAVRRPAVDGEHARVVVLVDQGLQPGLRPSAQSPRRRASRQRCTSRL